MSIVSEYIIQTALVRGISRFRKDPKLVEQLFRNLDQGNLANVKKFINKGTIDICLGYPGDLKLPSIIIILKSETEKSAFIGDELETEIPETFEYMGGDDGLVNGVTSSTNLSGYPTLVFGPFDVLSSTNNTLRIATKEWSFDQFSGKSLNVHIVSGTGRGQVRKIDSNAQDFLMITSTWLTNPDSTSKFEVRKPPDEVIGEPSGLYNERGNTFINRRGVLNAANYQLLVVGSSPEQTILLTTIIKSIFILYRMFLEGQGLIDLKMSSTDLVPKNEMNPDIAYTRSINLEFSYHFDIFEELENPEFIRTVIEVKDNDEITIVNDSTITI